MILFKSGAVTQSVRLARLLELLTLVAPTSPGCPRCLVADQHDDSVELVLDQKASSHCHLPIVELDLLLCHASSWHPIFARATGVLPATLLRLILIDMVIKSHHPKSIRYCSAWFGLNLH